MRRFFSTSAPASPRQVLQRPALILILAAVAVSAVVGIAALVSGDPGDTQGRILGTTWTVSGACLLALASATGVGRTRLRAFPPAGVLTAIAAGITIIIGLWAEPDSEVYWKTTASLAIAAVAFAHSSVMTWIRLPHGLRSVQTLARIAGAVLAVTIVAALWAEPDTSLVPRIIGIEAIVAASASIAVPVLYRLTNLDRDESPVRFGHCPACGAPSAETVEPGQVLACSSCRVRTRVEYLGTVREESRSPLATPHG